MAGKGFFFVWVTSLLIVCCVSRKEGYDYCEYTLDVIHTTFREKNILTYGANLYVTDYLEDDCRLGPTIDLANTNFSLYGYVRVTREASYWPNMQCSVRVVAPRYYQLTMRIRYVDTKCEHAYLELSGSNESSSEPSERPNKSPRFLAINDTAELNCDNHE